MNETRKKALDILAAEAHGWRPDQRCTRCDDLRCDRNFPALEESVWAKGVIDGFNSLVSMHSHLEVTKEEINHHIEQYGAELGDASLKR